MSILEESKRLKDEATVLLNEGNLLKTLEKYGEVVIRGSYAVNLMLKHDVDINVIGANADKKAAIAALNEFIQDDYFESYHLYDWFKTRKEAFPEGYYIGLQKVVNGEKWKVDIWFLTKEDERALPVMNKLASLSDNDREAVLNLKKHRTESDLKINSYQIYEAFTEKGIRTTDALQEYVKTLN